MHKYLNNIDKQIKSNQGKNIFLDGQNTSFQFIDELNHSIAELSVLNDDSFNLLVEYTTNKALEEFYRINQYYSFNSQAKSELKNIYSDLFSSARIENQLSEVIREKHYRKLKQWLQKTNPFAPKLYSNAGHSIDPVACSEYSPELQIQILGITAISIMEPVLDIGCGKDGSLVNYFCGNGIDAYGMDRYPTCISNFINSDWLEYDYGRQKWGTIISNLGFSNHFKHHHLREDGNYIEYGQKFVEILQSLKIGGRFHYAPGLPFIEQYLDRGQFRIEVIDSRSTIITRLK